MSIFQARPWWRPQAQLIDNKVAGGRPRIEHLPTDWHAPVLPTFCPRGFVNRRADGTSRMICYRNVAVQLLLNTPMFVSWLATHDQVNCPYKELLGSEDCLACSLKHLAAGYWEHPRCTDAEFELRMTKFWDLCCEVFWGGRARRKRGGLLNPHEGGYEDEFLLYLIRELQEQSESVPSVYQTIKSMFTVHAREFVQCVQYDPKNVTKERVLPGSGFQSVTHCGVTSKCFWWEEMDYLPLLSHDKGPVEVTSGVAYRNQHSQPPLSSLGDSHLLSPRTARLRQRSGPVRQCPTCGNEGAPVVREIVDAPEVLIVLASPERTNRKLPDVTFYQEAGKVSPPVMNLTDFTADLQPLEYTLVGATLLDETGTHVKALVLGPDNEFYECDDDFVRQSPLKDFNKHHKLPHNGRGNFFPAMIIYKRTDTTGKVDVASGGSKASGPVSTSRLGSDGRSSKRRSQSLGASPPTGKGVAKRRRKTKNGIDVQFTQGVGEAVITAALSLSPSEVPANVRAHETDEAKRVTINCTYSLHGKMWQGDIQGDVPHMSFVSTQAEASASARY